MCHRTDNIPHPSFINFEVWTVKMWSATKTICRTRLSVWYRWWMNKWRLLLAWHHTHMSQLWACRSCWINNGNWERERQRERSIKCNFLQSICLATMLLYEALTVIYVFLTLCVSKIGGNQFTKPFAVVHGHLVASDRIYSLTS